MARLLGLVACGAMLAGCSETSSSAGSGGADAGAVASIAGATSAGAPFGGQATAGSTVGGAGAGVPGAGSGGVSDAGAPGGGSGGAPNLNPPSLPTGLQIKGDDCERATLTWGESTANPAGAPLHGYQIYVDGVFKFMSLETTQPLVLNAWHFAAGVTYSLEVAAVAEDGAVSGKSIPLPYTPKVCANAPEPPTGARAVAAGCREVKLDWQPASHAGAGEAVAGYLVYRDGKAPGETSSYTSFDDFGVEPGKPHTYLVQTYSNQALVSTPVSLMVVTPACSDTTPPSKPSGLSGKQSDGACSYAYLNWSKSTDDVGVHHYDVYRDGMLVESDVSSPGAGVELVPQLTFKFDVVAVDASGNSSEHSDPVTITADCSALYQKRSFRTAVMLGNFPDEQEQPFSKADVNTRVFGGPGSGSLAAYIAESTYGLVDASVGSVFGWYTMPRGIGSYCPGPGYIDCSNELATDSLAAAKSDLGATKYDQFISVFAGIGTAGVGGGGHSVISSSAFDLGSMAHELGHSLGLDHAGDLECTGGEITASNLLDLSEGGCQPGRYTDGYDVMGAGNVGQYSSYNKELIGALKPEQVAIAKASGTYDVEVLENPSAGVKELRIPLEVNGFFYFLEYRKPIGTDAVDPIDGVLIRLRATTSLTDAKTLRLHTIINPDTPFFDRYRQLKVEVVSKTDTKISLKVTR